MKQYQFFFLFAAVYLAPRVSEDLALTLAAGMTIMGLCYLFHGGR
jgi:hypothetical protein